MEGYGNQHTYSYVHLRHVQDISETREELGDLWVDYKSYHNLLIGPHSKPEAGINLGNIMSFYIICNWRASSWEWKRRVKSWLKTQYSKNYIMTSSPITSWQIDGGKWKERQILFSWAPKSLLMVSTAMKLKMMLLGRKSMTNPDSILRSRDIILQQKLL